MMTLCTSNPIHDVVNYAVRAFPGCLLEFGIYRYIPQAIDDERRIEKVLADNAVDWLSDVSSTLGDGEEVALHSRVHLREPNSPTLHLGMVDFRTDDLHVVDWARAEILGGLNRPGSFLVKSGRSFHLYVLRPLTESEGIKFMGRLLLLNSPDGKEVIDGRWVGHRLLAGYGSLRLTKRSDMYLMEPSVVEADYGLGLAVPPTGTPPTHPATATAARGGVDG
jgi:hypothetical protein